MLVLVAEEVLEQELHQRMARVLHLTALPLLVVVLVVGGKIMVLFINLAHPLMRVVHTITVVHQADQVLFQMVVAPVMMPAAIGVQEEVVELVDLAKAALQEAPEDLALVTILEPTTMKRTAKEAMVVAMQMEMFPELLEQLIPVTVGMVVLTQPELLL